MTIGCPQLSHVIWFENSKDTLNANDIILDDENHLKHGVKQQEILIPGGPFYVPDVVIDFRDSVLDIPDPILCFTYNNAETSKQSKYKAPSKFTGSEGKVEPTSKLRIQWG